MTEEPKIPQWGYRMLDGKEEARLFPEGRPSRGWADTPAKLKKSDDDDA